MIELKKINFIDLFSGCGGFSEGFLESNKYNAVGHVEWEYPMVSVLRRRLHEKWNISKEDAFKSVIVFCIFSISPYESYYLSTFYVMNYILIRTNRHNYV